MKTHDGKFFKPSRVLGANYKRDFLFLEVPGLDSYGHLEFNDQYKVGQKVFTIGNVSGQGIAIRSGEVASKTQDPDDPSIEFIRYSAAASPGNSGGPLVDAYGKVVALVFARSPGENYNLGTSSEYLLEGKKQFVDDMSPKPFKVKPSEILGFKGLNLLPYLNYPIPSSWFENPQYGLKLDNVEGEITLPLPFANYIEEVLMAVDKSVNNIYKELLAEMEKESILNDTWHAHLKAGMPIIVPYQLDKGAEVYKIAEDLSINESKFEILQPSNRHSLKNNLRDWLTENRYSYYSQRNAVEFFEPKKIQINKKIDLPKFKNGESWYLARTGKNYLSAFFPGMSRRPSMQAFFHNKKTAASWEELRVFPNEMLLKGIVGEEGVLISTRSQYVRPKAHKEVVLNNLEESFVVNEITDSLGRKWQRKTFNIFDNLSVESYCTPLPQGAGCLTYTLSGFLNDTLVKINRQKFADYKLNTMYLKPRFWKLDALSDFIDKGYGKTYPSFSDFKIIKNGDKSTLSFETLGIQIPLTKNQPDAIKIHHGLTMINDQEKWVSLGAELYFKSKKSPKICGIGMEIDGHNSSDFLNSYRESKAKKDNKSAGNKFTKAIKKSLWTSEFTSKTLNKKVNTFGYCMPLEKSSSKAKNWNLNQFKIKPYKVPMKI